MTLTDKIVNIPLSSGFVDVLAQKLSEEYAGNPLALADVLILLPNRRACKALADAFVRLRGMSPTLLPQMMPLGDVDEDDMMLSGAVLEEGWQELPPAIDTVERLMLFIRLIMAKPDDFGLEKMSLNQACYLAQDLAGLIDAAHNGNLDFSRLADLVPEEYASHWQETLEFLKIITFNWPAILAERGLSDASSRRNLLLEKQAEIWTLMLPGKRIIAAGTTATFPAMKKLVKAIIGLPRGQLVLSGLDKVLDEESWAALDETHPQFELKELLDFLQVERREISDWTVSENPQRELLISEIMRPAATTDKWREISERGLDERAWEGIRLLNCRDIREEALAIALIMRETLETPEKTAALVTSDRNLARRVAAELERWNLKVDDSAGCPLSLTPVGEFLRLVVAAASPEASRVDILSLLKHPLCGLGRTYGEVRSWARRVELVLWRGGKEDDVLKKWLDEVCSLWQPLTDLYLQKQADLKEILATHIRTAEKLAATGEKSGDQILWRGEDGEAAAGFVSKWYEQAEVLGNTVVEEYNGLFEAMMAGVTVRPKYGTHPRLKILGPIEARLNRADRVIVGEMNEGVWPLAAVSDPWMSRPMKKDFGFPLPERAVGVSAADLCGLLGAKEVFITRAERVQGTPMVKSRWLLRLETVFEALAFSEGMPYDKVYVSQAAAFDEPEFFEKANAPAPCPPPENRPKELSASGIELLMRDPYSVFAKYILQLRPLERIDPDLTMADYGTIVHGILERFNNKYDAAWPDNAKEELLMLGRRVFDENALAAERRAFWWPAFEKIVDWITETEQQYRVGIKKVHNEQSGRFCFDSPMGRFTVTAKADRVDETVDGKINIIDYKTGKARTPKEVAKGFAPQLPIEGLIAQSGGFSDIPAADVNRLIYWQLAKKQTIIEDNMPKLLSETEQRLKELINIFSFASTPYICHPNPRRIPEYSDYEHLARVREWSVQEEGEGGSMDD